MKSFTMIAIISCSRATDDRPAEGRHHRNRAPAFLCSPYSRRRLQCSVAATDMNPFRTPCRALRHSYDDVYTHLVYSGNPRP